MARRCRPCAVLPPLMLWLGAADRVRCYRHCVYGSALPAVCGSTAAAFMARRCRPCAVLPPLTLNAGSTPIPNSETGTDRVYTSPVAFREPRRSVETGSRLTQCRTTSSSTCWLCLASKLRRAPRALDAELHAIRQSRDRACAHCLWTACTHRLWPFENHDARCAAGAPYSTRAVAVAGGPALPGPPPPAT